MESSSMHLIVRILDSFINLMNHLHCCSLHFVEYCSFFTTVRLPSSFKHRNTIIIFHQILKVDGTSFSDAGSLVTTAHLTCEICPRDLKYRKSKTNITYQLFFFLSVPDWIKTKVVLWASVVKQFSMRQKNTFCSSMPEIQGQNFHQW